MISDGDGLLGLHVLGGGVGESIVLELPQGGWGVIDCYASTMRDPATNLTCQFLHSRHVQSLEFLALSHPHADHYRGLLDLLDAFPVRRFWRFGGLSSQELPRLIRGLRQDARERRNTRQGSEARYLQDVLERVAALRRNRSLQVTAMQDVKPLYPTPHGQSPPSGVAQVFSLGPQTGSVETYQEQLSRCFDREDRLLPNLPGLNQNMISAALRVVYGGTTLILGGDVERQGWEEIVAAVAPDWLAAQAVKVSHHGSPTGYSAGLWALFCAHGQPTAVITPYHRFRLPTRETYDHIRQYTPHVATTCLPAIAFTTTPHEFAEDTNPVVRLALGATFPKFRALRRHTEGICSFWFDNKGVLIRQAFTGAAGTL